MLSAGPNNIVFDVVSVIVSHNDLLIEMDNYTALDPPVSEGSVAELETGAWLSCRPEISSRPSALKPTLIDVIQNYS